MSNLSEAHYHNKGFNYQGYKNIFKINTATLDRLQNIEELKSTSAKVLIDIHFASVIATNSSSLQPEITNTQSICSDVKNI